MPKAVRSEETFRKDLKSVPEGYVVVRRLSYGEKQRRMTIAGGQSYAANRGGNGQPDKVDITINAFEIQFYDFSRCIVEHNLSKDDEGQVLINFKNAADFELLDDAVGTEIEEFLDSINNEGDLTSFQASNGTSDSQKPLDIGTGSPGT